MTAEGKKVVYDLSRVLEKEGACRAETLKYIFEDGPEVVLAQAFPDHMGFKDEVLEYLEFFMGALPGMADMERRLSRHSSSRALDDVLNVYLSDAKRRRREEETEERKKPEKGPGRVALKARASWGHGAGPATMKGMDEKEYHRWAVRALRLLEMAGGPSVLAARAA